MNDSEIQLATVEEEEIKRLLAAAGLPYDDIHMHLHNFLVARHDDVFVVTVGLEIYGELGLLRSLVVASISQGNGIGRMLYDRVMAYAPGQGTVFAHDNSRKVLWDTRIHGC